MVYIVFFILWIECLSCLGFFAASFFYYGSSENIALSISLSAICFLFFIWLYFVIKFLKKGSLSAKSGAVFAQLIVLSFAVGGLGGQYSHIFLETVLFAFPSICLLIIFMPKFTKYLDLRRADLDDLPEKENKS